MIRPINVPTANKNTPTIILHILYGQLIKVMIVIILPMDNPKTMLSKSDLCF